MATTSKVDLAYQYILNEIASKQIVSGDRIIISKIADICKVSEIPVREALRNLQRDGYVDITPNQGAVVVGISEEAVSTIIQAKGVLEGFATRLSIDYISPHDLEEFHKINLAIKDAIQKNDSALVSELNQKFHMAIYGKLPQKELVSMISALWNKWSFTKRIFSFSPEVRNHVFEEHEIILQLISERKYEETEQFVREHKFKTAEHWNDMHK